MNLYQEHTAEANRFATDFNLGSYESSKALSILNEHDSYTVRRFHKIYLSLHELKTSWLELKDSYKAMAPTARTNLASGYIEEMIMLSALFNADSTKKGLMEALREDHLGAIHFADRLASCITVKVSNGKH